MQGCMVKCIEKSTHIYMKMELESCGEYFGINREPASSPQLTAAVLLFLKSWRIAAFPPFIAAVSIYRATAHSKGTIL